MFNLSICLETRISFVRHGFKKYEYVGNVQVLGSHNVMKIDNMVRDKSYKSLHESLQPFILHGIS